MPTLELRIQIDYSAEDDIRNFADYIMELDPTNKSFYFIYRYAIDIDTFRKSIDTEFEKLHERFKKLGNDAEKDKNVIRIIKDMFVHIYSASCKEMTYFSDRAYVNIVHLVEDSSGKNKSGTKISKRGRKNLRNVLYQMALTMVATNDKMRQL